MELLQIKGFLNTPDLWETTLLDVEQFNIPRIAIDNFEFKPIPKNIRLGQQIEYIFHHLITNSNAYDILLFNQPIRDEFKTLGEIDFILKDVKTQDIIHVELTYKFYLIDDSKTSIIQQLIGPNNKDSFLQKIQKIKNQQFKLLKTTEAVKVLTNHSIPITNIRSKACFKGQLFIRYRLLQLDISPFNLDCIVGYWITYKEFSTSDFKKSEYYIPAKAEWIITPNKHANWLSYSDTKVSIKNHIENRNSPMIWKKNANFTYEKFFVVWW